MKVVKDDYALELYFVTDLSPPYMSKPLPAMFDLARQGRDQLSAVICATKAGYTSSYADTSTKPQYMEQFKDQQPQLLYFLVFSTDTPGFY